MTQNYLVGLDGGAATVELGQNLIMTKSTSSGSLDGDLHLSAQHP